MVDAGVAVENSKKEDTWHAMLGHYDAEFDTARRVFYGQWQGRHRVQMARPERQPQRVGVQLVRFEAQPELQLV